MDCRFRHYGDNPRNALMEELHKKIALKAKRKKKKAKKKRQRQKRSNKKKNLKRDEQREIMKEKSNEHHLPKVVGIHEHLLKKDVKNLE